MASLGSDPRFFFSFWGLTLVFSFGALTPIFSGAQQYKLTPVDQCFSFGHLRFGPGGNNTYPLTSELAAKGAEARSLCEQAIKDRPNEGRLHATLARLRAIGGDRAGALEAARAGVALGDKTARVLLGVMLAEGQGVRRDYAAAREQFRLAARDDSPFARFNLGAILANGWGVEVDEGDAAATFLRAAKEGDPLAMQIAGQRYDQANAEPWFRKAAETMTTEGVREPLRIADIGRAALEVAPLLAWYESKARAGEPWAQGYLGALYEAGQWVKQDDAQAALWYRQAGEAGHMFAQWRMATFYREGRGGLPQDKAEANRWSMMWLIKRCDDHERAGAAANACDRLAADGFDPQRAAAGVDSFCMRHFAERAVAACSVAVKQSPATVRYRTQLARSLAHTGRFDEARREASGAAAAGSTASMIMLGAMSQRGLGVPANPVDALTWYRKAAEAGNERGVQLVLASIQKGVGIAKDSAEAKALSDAMRARMTPKAAPSLAERAAAGDAHSQFNLAAQLEQEKNYEEALKWYTRAAAQGFGLAELNVAQMYERGIGVKQDSAEARKRYRKLADAGDGEARWRAARLALGASDHDEALRLLNRSVRDDDYRAILDVGTMYEQGRGVKKDVGRAVELYERVGERSYWASAKLGTLYLQGDGIPQDYAKARARLQRAAGGGNAAARNNLGVMYERGLGVGVDHATAAELYFAALAGDNVQARGNLERLFAEGRGAPAGAARVAWYRRGADADIAAAQYRLGRMYAKGDAVPRNDEAALQWLMKAAQQGHPEARKEAGELLYALGRDMDAAALGHEGAARRLALKLAASGRPDAAAELNRFLADARSRVPPPPAYPDGIAQHPGADQSREIAVRVGGVGDIQINAISAVTADPWDIIRW
jgi:TPR repeat protein